MVSDVVVTGAVGSCRGTRLIAAHNLRGRLKLENQADREVKRLGGRLRAALLDAIRNHRSAERVILDSVNDMALLILMMLIMGHAEGEAAAVRRLRARLRNRRRFAATPLEKEITRLIKRVKARAPGDLDRLRLMYEDEARKAAHAGMEVLVSRMDEVTASTSLQVIRKKLDLVGIGYVKPHFLKTIIRTQLHIGYSGGKQDQLQDPVFEDELWGYEYVGILDDRIRPNHAALDGVRLPKDDPRWQEIMPPNGYNCRCDVIEIWNDERPTLAWPDHVEVNGEPALPEPDKGFKWNPRSKQAA